MKRTRIIDSLVTFVGRMSPCDLRDDMLLLAEQILPSYFEEKYPEYYAKPVEYKPGEKPLRADHDIHEDQKQKESNLCVAIMRHSS